MSNPFTLELALGQQLVNRQAELQAVKQTLQSGSKLFVMGPRRFGKTSVLLTAANQLRAEGMIILDFNVEGFTSLELLVRALVGGAAGLAGNLNQAAKSLRRFFTTLQPSVTAGVDGTLTASLGIKTPEATAQAPLLMDALNSLEQMARHSKRKVGVIFDEFPHLLKLGGASLEGQLRAAVQTHKQIGYVFAGSQTTLISDMVSNPARPFYRLGENLFMEAIPRAEWVAFCTASFGALNCQIGDDAITTLLDLAEDVPYNVQALARACWDEVNQTKALQLTVDLVQSTQQRLVRSNAPLYMPLWSGLTVIQQKTLAAIAHHQGQQLLGQAVLKRYDLSSGALQKALIALENNSYIRKEYQPTGAVYRFEDPFFKAWVIRSTISS